MATQDGTIENGESGMNGRRTWHKELRDCIHNVKICAVVLVWVGAPSAVWLVAGVVAADAAELVSMLTAVYYFPSTAVH